MSKSALHRRRSSSGDRLNSSSVITDLDPTTSLSLSFSNLGNFASQSRLDTKTKTDVSEEKKHTTHKTYSNTSDELPASSETNSADAPRADNNEDDGDSIAQSLNLILPDLLTANPAPREDPTPMTEGQKQLAKGGGITMRDPGFFTDPPPQEESQQGDFEAFGDAEEKDRQRSSPQRPPKTPKAKQGGGIAMRSPGFFDPPPQSRPLKGK